MREWCGGGHQVVDAADCIQVGFKDSDHPAAHTVPYSTGKRGSFKGGAAGRHQD
jgi:hypothetical protein